MGVYGQNARPLVVNVIGSALTYEAMEVASAHIRDLEQKYAANPDSVVDLTQETVVLTGKTPYKVFIFELTTIMAAGGYEFVCREVVPNVESATTLQQERPVFTPEEPPQ